MRIANFKNSLFHFVIKNSIFGLISTLKKNHSNRNPKFDQNESYRWFKQTIIYLGKTFFFLLNLMHINRKVLNIYEKKQRLNMLGCWKDSHELRHIALQKRNDIYKQY